MRTQVSFRKKRDKGGINTCKVTSFRGERKSHGKILKMKCTFKLDHKRAGSSRFERTTSTRGPYQTI
jgi:hypothetical protein